MICVGFELGQPQPAQRQRAGTSGRSSKSPAFPGFCSSCLSDSGFKCAARESAVMAGSGLKLGVVIVLGVLIVGGLFVLTLGSILLDTPGPGGETLDPESPPSTRGDGGVDLSRDGARNGSGGVAGKASRNRSAAGQNASVPRGELLAAYSDSLESGGVNVQSLGVRRGVLWLNYSSNRTNESVVRREIGVVAGYYASVVERGLNVSRLEARIIDGENGSVATYRIETGWARGFLDDEVSRDEYASRIYGSLETPD